MLLGFEYRFINANFWIFCGSTAEKRHTLKYTSHNHIDIYRLFLWHADCIGIVASSINTEIKPRISLLVRRASSGNLSFQKSRVLFRQPSKAFCPPKQTVYLLFYTARFRTQNTAARTWLTIYFFAKVYSNPHPVAELFQKRSTS